MSYGEVAKAAGYPRHARRVSLALARFESAKAGRHVGDDSNLEVKLPWYRVIRSDGRIAFAFGSEAYKTQEKLLLAEGVKLVNGKVSNATRSANLQLDQLLWNMEGRDE